MRKYLLISIALIASFSVFSQDFSNKGKDFWVGYGYHSVMSNGNAGYCSAAGGGAQQMVLYFATDQVTNITISIPGFPFTVQTITTGPGFNVTTSTVMPKTGANDARLCSEGLSNKGIHITSDKPMVAYAHIYNGNCSGATILYPTNTLGKEYYSVNYKTISNSQNPNCWFYVVAVDTGTTNLEITPTANTEGGWTGNPATPYTVSLTQGQIYNVMGARINNTSNPYTGVDLTGSHIKSVSLGLSGCKRIAVFSGSGRISINCPNTSSSSSDNYMVQAMPKTAWGKKYLTIPAAGGQSFNIYRICVQDPTTVVKINGVVTALPLQNSFYYEIAATNQPQMIEGDKPIMVAQYFTSQGSCGNNAMPGDPEVIYLSAVEQNINTVQWNATPNFAITNHYFNVVIPNGGTALSSFTYDGAPIGGWIVDPWDPNYSYLRPAVTAGTHIIKSDSGFNAIAYGFGNAESYGYNAGTNIKDLYQQIGVQTQYGIETTPSVCTNSPFKFKVSLPYCADSIRWDLGSLPGPPTAPPTVIYTNCTPGAVGGPDSSSVVNTKTIYWYSLPSTYTFGLTGNFSVTITAYNNANPDNCGNAQDIDFTLQVSEPPIAGFTNTTPGCVADTVYFTETTPQIPKPTYHFYWDFGDPGSGAANTSNLRNPKHVFSGPGTYTVKFSDITTPGCLSDTLPHQITVNPLPSATISGTTTVCINSTAPPVTFTGTNGSPEYIFSYTIDNGSGPGPILTTPLSVGGVAQIFPLTNVAGTFTYTLDSVRDQLPAGTLCKQSISGQQVTVTVNADATTTLTSGPATANQTVCINTPITNITYAIGGSGTSATVTGPLPPGVNWVYNGGVVTISGTPTLAGSFPFTVTPVGPCQNPPVGGTIIVTDDATISLSSAPPTANQMVCLNMPINAITYIVGGSGTGAGVTFTPPLPGVSGTYSGGVFTITGTPTLSGSFTYTVTTTGPCQMPSLGGTINVNVDATNTLTSAPATTNQTLCVNTAITNITYAIGGSGTGATVTFSPPLPGVTGVYSGGVVTISGTPTLGGSYTYTVTPVGPCQDPPLSGTINVSDNATISLTSAPSTTNQTLCINNPINNITYIIGGGGTGAAVTFTPALPGVSGFYSGGIFTITGTPTLSGSFTYTVSTTGTCINPSLGGTILVNADATTTLTSAPATTNQTVCINTAITNITYAIGGSGTGATITFSPPLPGVTGVYSGGVVTISGTPTATPFGAYNYTVTPIGPCQDPSLSGTINVNDNATVTLTSAPGTNLQSVCVNNSITTITYVVSGVGTTANVTGPLPPGVNWVYSGGIVTISGTPTTSNPAPYNYSINISGPCIPANSTGSITVNPDHTLTLTSAPSTANQTICQNTSIVNITYAVGGGGNAGIVTFTAGAPAGINWVSVGGVVTISGTPTVAGSYPYTVTTSGNSCQPAPPLSGTITVNADGTISMTSVPATAIQELCRNSTIVPITFAIGGGATGATVSPPLPAGISGVYSGGVFTISGTPTVASPGTVYTITTAGGLCVQNSKTITLTIDDLPTADFTFSAPDCQSKNITFTDASTANTGLINTWQWDFGDGNTGNVTPITHVYANAQPYTVTLTVTTNKGCVSFPIASKVVTVAVNPQAGFMIPAICLNDVAAMFTDTSKISTGNIIGWWWNFGDPASGAANTQITQNGTHTFTNVGNFQVTHVAISSTGCTDTVKQNVFVNGANPTANFSINNPAALCANDSVGITNLSTVAPGSITKVEIYWDNIGAPAGPPQVDNATVPNKVYKHLYPNFQVPLTKNYSIRYLAYSGIICVNEVTKIITVHAAPKVQFNPLPDACFLSPPYQITQASEIGGVPGSGVFSGPGVTPTGIFTPAIAGIGTHTITYTYTSSAGGCIDTLSQPINVLDTATAAFSYNSPVCEHNDVTFTEMSTAPPGVVLANTVWNFGDGSPVENHAPGSVFTHIFPSAATYNVTMLNMSAYGCPSTISSQPVAISPRPRPNFTVDKPAYCLPNALVKFDPSSSTISDGSALIYSWDFGDILSGSNTSTLVNPTHLFSGAGPFNVTLTATSSPVGCAHDTMIVINTIHPQPKAMFTSNKPSVCIADDVTFTDQSDGMDGIVNQWNWDFGDGQQATTNPVTHLYMTTDTFNVSLYVVNNIGCNSDTLTRPFAVYPYPVVDAGGDRVVLEGGSITLQPIVSGNDLQFLWTPNLYMNDNTLENPTVTAPLDDITYTLKVTARGGCPISKSMFVKLLRFPKIPNTFTPNNDGINDTWVIGYLNTYPNNRVQVFTRTGQIVFESHGYNQPWDGTYKGKPLPFDTYYYIIEPGNGRGPITGYVTIVK